MSRSRRHTDHDEPTYGKASRKANRRHTHTNRLKEFEAEYTRKNQIPIITLE